MNRDTIKGVRALFGMIVVVALVASIFLSFKGFTGYIVYEEVDVFGNTLALVLFVVGIIGAFFLVRKK